MEKKLAYVGGDLIHHLPEPLLQDILSRLDPESLCSAAPACRLLRRFASQALASIATIDLSEFPPSAQVVDRVVGGNGVVKRLTLDCSRLDDSLVDVFVKEGLQELVLFKCIRFSSHVFSAIGEKCCNLRLLQLEMAFPDGIESVHTFEKALSQMLKRCLYLEEKNTEAEAAAHLKHQWRGSERQH